MVIRISDKTQNYSKVTKLLVKPIGIVSEMQKKTENLFSVLGMAGVLGFEPRKCQIQSLMPYRLAIPQCAYL